MPWSSRLLFPPTAQLNDTASHHLHYYFFRPGRDDAEDETAEPVGAPSPRPLRFEAGPVSD